MTPLFMDMLKCMMSNDVELKKLVYLYLINYAKTQPDFAIMAVNAFVRDSASPDPMIRAMSVRCALPRPLLRELAAAAEDIAVGLDSWHRRFAR